MKDRVVTFDRADKMAAVSAAAFLGLLAGESVLFGDATDVGGAADERIATRPDFADLERGRTVLLDVAEENSFIDASACRGYAAEASAGLRRLAADHGTAASPQPDIEREAPPREDS